jgi:hypothetical protein
MSSKCPSRALRRQVADRTQWRCVAAAVQEVLMSSPISPVDSDAAILSRLIEPEVDNLPAEVARYLLSLDFCQNDRDRMYELAAKAREGTLTPAEQHEAESYERIGHLVALLRSKARKSLKTASSGS